MTQELARRIAILTTLVERAGTGLGRTALMKFAYFLTVLRHVPLGYYFTLYSYGPFDSSVLEDIQYAEGLGAVKSTTEIYPSGYGYNIKPGPNADAAKALDNRFVSQHADDIDWVVREFGSLNAAELELASTIVYVDRAAAARGGERSSNDDQIAAEVKEIKRHFTMDRILTRLRWLKNKGHLKSV